jgi:hypothetical protein
VRISPTNECSEDHGTSEAFPVIKDWISLVLKRAQFSRKGPRDSPDHRLLWIGTVDLLDMCGYRVVKDPDLAPA